MKFNKRVLLNGLPAAALVLLTACTAGEAPLETGDGFVPEPEIDAATIDPCADQFAFQRELNGAPDDTAIEKTEAMGKSLLRQLYWYEDSRMIVFFSYAEGETWCNVWNENGVRWDY